jgi:hypothetical protein
VQELYGEYGLKGKSPSYAALTNTLQKTTISFDDIYLCVDAVDEQDDVSLPKFFSLVQALLRARVRVLVMTRPHVDIGESCSPFVRLTVNADIHDLATVVSSRLSQSRRFRSQGGLGERIMENLLANNDGM